FLHGFPESWYSWRHQIVALSEEYRVIAPDLRGYAETENRPPYDTDTLQRDVLSLIEALGERSAHIVGHDWGGAVVWLLAMGHPEAVRSLAICNMPHPSLFKRGVLRPRQLLRSSYIFLFQLPWLPERLLALDDYRMLARAIIRRSLPRTFTREDVRFMLATWRKHGLNGGLNWYRALLRDRPQVAEPPPLVTAPTTLIWGEMDFALERELTEGSHELVRNLTVHYFPEGGHFVH